MPALRELQERFVAAVLGRHALPCVEGPGLEIHANHYRLSLIEALATTFAPARRLVGEEYFDSLARRYVEARPPTDPCIARYGADFAEFIEPLPAAPFLPDVCRFAWALNLAQTTGSRPAVSIGALAALAPEALPELRLTLQPALSLVESAFPIRDLWALASCEGEDPPGVDLGRGGEAVLFWSEAGGPVWRPVDQGEVRFFKALQEGAPLGEAAGAALAADPLFHLAGAIGCLFDHGLVSALALTSARPSFTMATPVPP